MRLSYRDDLGVQKPSDHLLCVARQIGLGGKAVEFGAHERLTRGIIAPPCFEDGGHASAELRIYIIKRNQLIGHQTIGSAIGLVKRRRRHGQGSDQCAEAVWIFQGKIGMLQQIARDSHGLIGGAGGDLQAEPFVNHQALVAPLLVKLCHRLSALTMAVQIAERWKLQSHCLGLGKLLRGQCAIVDIADEAQGQSAQRARRSWPHPGKRIR